MQKNRKIRRIAEPKKNNPPNNYKRMEPFFELESANSRNVTKLKVQPNSITKSLKSQNSSNVTISKVEPVWKGETVYIIGGGPSLKDFNWNSLIGKRTIAINKAFYNYPNADILYWTDSRFYNWYKQDIDKFKGQKYTVTPVVSNISSDVKILKRGQKLGLEKNNDTLSHGNNSGYAALNLAYHLGVKRIILLGYDMGMEGTKSHFHDGYPINPTSNQIYKSQFIPSLDSLAPLLKNSGIDVYNANKFSKLSAYTVISIEKALSFR